MQETLEAIFLLIWDHKWQRLTTFMGATITQSSSFLRVWARCLKNQVKNSSRDLNEMQNMSGYRSSTFIKSKLFCLEFKFLNHIWNKQAERWTKYQINFMLFFGCFNQLTIYLESSDHKCALKCTPIFTSQSQMSLNLTIY